MDKYLEKIPVITKSDVKKIKDITDDYAYTFLNRLFKKNKIKKIKKGMYTYSDNVYEIATNIYSPSYISLLSASYFKGYTEQIINTIQIITTKSYKKINFENYKIEFYKSNESLFFGYEKQKFNNTFLFIADDEKLLIDALLFQEKMGNFDEIIKLIKKVNIDENKLIKYLNKINNTSLNKRIGFLLEYYLKIDISKRVSFKDKNYIQLSLFKKSKSINEKWRIKYDFN